MTRHSSSASRKPDPIPCPQSILAAQRLIEVPYHSFDGRCHIGQIVVHEMIAREVEEIFFALLALDFPIAKMIPLADPRYSWDDDRSMHDNNTTGFNYRTIDGTDRISWHGYGLAIDINPWHNPCIRSGHHVAPFGSCYDPTVYGTIIDGAPIVRLFLERGFVWGGHSTDFKDYQHFEKPIPSLQIASGLV